MAQFADVYCSGILRHAKRAKMSRSCSLAHEHNTTSDWALRGYHTVHLEPSKTLPVVRSLLVGFWMSPVVLRGTVMGLTSISRALSHSVLTSASGRGWHRMRQVICSSSSPYELGSGMGGPMAAGAPRAAAEAHNVAMENVCRPQCGSDAVPA